MSISRDATASALFSAVCALAVCGQATAASPSVVSRQMHERLIVLDTHLDTPALLARPGWDIMEAHSFDSDRSQVDFPRMVDGGLDGGFWALFTPQGPRTPEGYAAARDRALQIAQRIRDMVEKNPRTFEFATTAADAERIVKSRKRIVYQSMENAYPLGKDVSQLKAFHDLGVRMVGLVHFANNDFADSATDPKGPEWRGLSPLGKDLVREANRLGVILDASHASDQVLHQLIDLSKTPVILSHSGSKVVHNHPRNIDDELMKKLADSGGLIQINSLSDYMIDVPANPERAEALGQLRARFGATMTQEQAIEFAAARREVDARYPVPTATFDDFMRHLLHALYIVGPDHVGIGADWDGGGGVTGMWEVSELPQVTTRLLAAGYTEADLRKIWGGNVLRLLQAAEDHARKQAR
jgi:membrane dipeptidase